MVIWRWRLRKQVHFRKDRGCPEARKLLWIHLRTKFGFRWKLDKDGPFWKYFGFVINHLKIKWCCVTRLKILPFTTWLSIYKSATQSVAFSPSESSENHLRLFLKTRQGWPNFRATSILHFLINALKIKWCCVTRLCEFCPWAKLFESDANPATQSVGVFQNGGVWGWRSLLLNPLPPFLFLFISRAQYFRVDQNFAFSSRCLCFLYYANSADQVSSNVMHIFWNGRYQAVRTVQIYFESASERYGNGKPFGTVSIVSLLRYSR